jgi:hypothetical protein
MSDIALDQVVELALKLSVAEQAKLLERVAANLAREVDEPVHESAESSWTDEELAELFKPSTPKTGAEIAAMIQSGELNTSAWSEMMNPHIIDSVEWVKALRRDMRKRRNLDWDRE